MTKRKAYFLIVFSLAFFLIIGTLNVWAENDDSPRTFAITDQYPYPGKFKSTMRDQPVNTPFSLYVYIVNNGGQFKPKDAARNVKVTLYTEDGYELNSTPYKVIPEGVGYVEFQLSWPESKHVILKVTGTILKNGNDHKNETSSAQSNYFWIGDPLPSAQSGLGQVLWEKEVW